MAKSFLSLKDSREERLISDLLLETYLALDYVDNQ